MLYAPKPLRQRYYLLLALDAQLARIALMRREPGLAQLKLAWWRDTLANPPASGHPLVAELASVWTDAAPALIGLVDAWEEVAVDSSLRNAAEQVADARAHAFAAAAAAPADDRCRSAARRWTLVTLSAHAPDQEQRTAMLAAAHGIAPVKLPRQLRPLALLDGMARRTARRGGGALLGDRLSPLAALRLGIFGR